MDLEHPCTQECGRDEATDPSRGQRLRPRLGPKGVPLALEVWIDGTSRGRVTKPVIVLGRGRAADISIDSDLVSRRAALLRVCVHGITLEDFGAGTSVCVNDQRIHRIRLCALDRIDIGRSRLRLVERDTTAQLDPGRGLIE